MRLSVAGGMVSRVLHNVVLKAQVPWRGWVRLEGIRFAVCQTQAPWRGRVRLEVARERVSCVLRGLVCKQTGLALRHGRQNIHQSMNVIAIV